VVAPALSTSYESWSLARLSNLSTLRVPVRVLDKIVAALVPSKVQLPVLIDTSSCSTVDPSASWKSARYNTVPVLVAATALSTSYERWSMAPVVLKNYRVVVKRGLCMWYRNQCGGSGPFWGIRIWKLRTGSGS
jgi:hypothetical protein